MQPGHGEIREHQDAGAADGGRQLVDRGSGHAFGVGKLSTIARNGRGALVLVSLSGTTHGHAVGEARPDTASPKSS
jgi:hypothetical protein